MSRPLSEVRVAVLSGADPTDPDENSGAPAGVFNALREMCQVVPASAALPRPAQRAMRAATLAFVRPDDLRRDGRLLDPARNRAWNGRFGHVVRSRQAAARVAGAGQLDGCFHIASQFRVPRRIPSVTLDDCTVTQALQGYPRPELADPGVTRRWDRRQRDAYARARACCAMNHWAARSIVADCHIDPSRVHVVGLGCNHVVEMPADRDWTTPRFLFVGFDWQRKNGDAVLRAFREVRTHFPTAELAVVGGHPRIDLAGVTCHGGLALSRPEDRRQMEALYRAATCFVMPSWSEPTGTVHAEAGAAGLPSIGTKLGGVSTTIGPGGILVDPHSDAEIVQAMLDLSDPDVARQMGELARMHSAQFTWRKVAERLLRALAPADVDLSGLADFL